MASDYFFQACRVQQCCSMDVSANTMFISADSIECSKYACDTFAYIGKDFVLNGICPDAIRVLTERSNRVF